MNFWAHIIIRRPDRPIIAIGINLLGFFGARAPLSQSSYCSIFFPMASFTKASSVTKSHHSTKSSSTASGVFKARTASTGRVVWVGRFIFISCLLCVALALGSSAHHFLSEAETGLAETQFESIAARALDTSYEITVRKQLGTISMASIAANEFPAADSWPFVAIDGYEVIASNLIATSSGREMGLFPLVTPDQLQDFENFAYRWYEEDREPPFPNGTAQSSFGKGVWGISDDAGTPDGRYHETDASQRWSIPCTYAQPSFPEDSR